MVGCPRSLVLRHLSLATAFCSLYSLIMIREAKNLVEVLRRQAERLGPRPALRFKRHGLYHDLSWQDYFQQSLACAAALVEQGLAVGDRVGLLSENRLEW